MEHELSILNNSTLGIICMILSMINMLVYLQN